MERSWWKGALVGASAVLTLQVMGAFAWWRTWPIPVTVSQAALTRVVAGTVRDSAQSHRAAWAATLGRAAQPEVDRTVRHLVGTVVVRIDGVPVRLPPAVAHQVERRLDRRLLRQLDRDLRSGSWLARVVSGVASQIGTAVPVRMSQRGIWVGVGAGPRLWLPVTIRVQR